METAFTEQETERAMCDAWQAKTRGLIYCPWEPPGKVEAQSVLPRKIGGKCVVVELQLDDGREAWHVSWLAWDGTYGQYWLLPADVALSVRFVHGECEMSLRNLREIVAERERRASQ